MLRLRLAVAITFLVSGILEVVFGLFSIIGVVTGLTLSAGDVPYELRELQGLGSLLFWLYLIIGLAAWIGAIAHLVAAARMLRGHQDPGVVWAATIASIFPLFTVYCALPSLVAGILGLLVLLLPEEPSSRET